MNLVLHVVHLFTDGFCQFNVHSSHRLGSEDLSEERELPLVNAPVDNPLLELFGWSCFVQT